MQPLSDSQRQSRPRRLDMPSPPATRSQSVASDSTSAFKAPLLPSPQMSRRPEPAYIAASAASQIVTFDQDPISLELADEHDAPTGGEPALVTQASLKLVNSFLDQLLYDFLSVARSTSLASLRPAVTEILRPTLAREAITGADQELHEYLGRGVEEEQLGYQEDPGPTGTWDLDAVWRQARLRCMVYSSLGDMEGEEEEMFLAEERHPMDSSGYFPEAQDLVSPAVAIFLTSILEFVGEQILLLAGQAAAHRVLSRKRDANVHDGPSTPADGIERLIVDELDTEKVALNPTFGRLWRAWRKRLRTSVASYPRSMSRDSNVSRRRQHSITSSSRRSSIDTVEPRSGPREHSRTKSLREVPEEDLAAKIALPMSANDIEEIEVPGVADLDDYARGGDETESIECRGRPQSLTIPRVMPGEQSFPDLCRTYAPPILSQLRTSKLLYLSRNRSQSLPSLARAAFGVNLPNDELTPTKPSHRRHTSNLSTAGQQERHLEFEVKRNFSRAADVDHIHHKERSDDEDQASRLILSEHYKESLPVQYENQRVGISRLATSTGTTAADNRTASPGSSLGPITEHATEGSHASDMLNSQTEKRFDSRSVSPLDPSDIDDAPAIIDFEANPQLDDMESGASYHAAIGVARTSNFPVFAAKPTYLTNPSTGPHTSESQQEGNLTWSKGQDVSTHEMESALSGQRKETRGSVQRRPNHQSHESPVLPQSTGFRADHAAASKRELPLELQQSGIMPSPGALTAENERGPNLSGTLASRSSINGQPADSDLASFLGTLPAQQPSAGSRKSEPRVDFTPATSTGRASVQRLFNPPSSPREVAATSPKRSDSLGKGRGSVHSAIQGSPTSKNLGPQLHDEEEVQKRAGSHPDETLNGVTGRKHSPTAVKPSSKEKSFEQLMRSDETIQYTLTPPNMREMEETLRRTDNTEPAKSPKKIGPTFNTQPPPSDAKSTLTVAPSDGKGLKPALSISRPLRPPSTSRSGAPVARDGRAEWSSTRDFAEFIRNTGPERGSETMSGDVPSRSDSIPSKQGRSRPGGGPLRPIRSRSKKISAAVQPSISEQRSESSRSSSTPKSKVRLQARDAVVSQKDDSSALVDFIRQGPPDQKDGQASSIAQIAPFASPSDSNPSASRAGGRVRDMTSTQSIVSTRNGSSKSQSQSIHSSFNSQTALLDKQAIMGEATRSENQPPVVRKQRRVRDPYAIDSDDEDEEGDEEDIDSKPRAKPGREESLMDFLRNVPPPPAQTTLPSAFDGLPKPGSKTLQKQRDTSSPTTKTRFGRGEFPKTISSKSVGKKATTSQGEQVPSSRSSIVSSQPPQLSLPSHGHDSTFDTTDALRAAARSVVGNPASAHHAHQPRSGVSEQGRSSDLVEFLKSTEPPPPVTASRRPPPVGKEESGFSKMFRKIKS